MNQPLCLIGCIPMIFGTLEYVLVKSRFILHDGTWTFAFAGSMVRALGV